MKNRTLFVLQMKVLSPGDSEVVEEFQNDCHKEGEEKTFYVLPSVVMSQNPLLFRKFTAESGSFFKAFIYLL